MTVHIDEHGDVIGWDTFTDTCSDCLGTIEVVDGVSEPHDCPMPESLRPVVGLDHRGGRRGVRRRRFYYDLPLDCETAPEPGDILHGPLVDHRVVDVWPTDSRQWPNRWTVTIVSLGPHEGRTPTGRWWPVRTYRRGEGPAEFFDQEAA